MYKGTHMLLLLRLFTLFLSLQHCRLRYGLTCKFGSNNSVLLLDKSSLLPALNRFIWCLLNPAPWPCKRLSLCVYIYI
uniref:Putative secreted protein n=1 Tax=Anopheles darlingi TaxID=43151 RepID=A0A2M4DDD3_ANODA